MEITLLSNNTLITYDTTIINLEINNKEVQNYTTKYEKFLESDKKQFMHSKISNIFSNKTVLITFSQDISYPENLNLLEK